MSSGYYDRKAFPHENDAEFERVLRNISSQEAMPRPMLYGSDRIDSDTLSEFYGDTWHWDNLTLSGWVWMCTRFFAYLGMTST